MEPHAHVDVRLTAVTLNTCACRRSDSLFALLHARLAVRGGVPGKAAGCQNMPQYIYQLQVQSYEMTAPSDDSTAAVPPLLLPHPCRSSPHASPQANSASSYDDVMTARRKTPKRLAAEALLASRHAAAKRPRPAWALSLASLDGGSDSVLSSRQSQSAVQCSSSAASDIDSCTSSQSMPQLSRFAAADAAGAAAMHTALAAAAHEPPAAATTCDWQAVRVAACTADAPCCQALVEQPADSGVSSAEGAATGFRPATGAPAVIQQCQPGLQLPMQRANMPHWCSFPVAVPHLDWAALLSELALTPPQLQAPPSCSTADSTACSTMALGPIQVGACTQHCMFTAFMCLSAACSIPV